MKNSVLVSLLYLFIFSFYGYSPVFNVSLGEYWLGSILFLDNKYTIAVIVFCMCEVIRRVYGNSRSVSEIKAETQCS